MELELGLALSNIAPFKVPSLKELDLISNVNFLGKRKCGDYDNDDDNDGSSTLSCQSSVNYEGECDQESGSYGGVLRKKQRGIGEVDSSEVCQRKTLPLLLWDNQPNEDGGDDDDDQYKRLCKFTTFTVNKNENDEIVGWPPIKSYRRKQTEANQQRRQCGRHAVENGGGRGGSRSMYVKVQIEGYLITRKIDLMVYNSYEALISSLLFMFGKGPDFVDDYKLTYQDREGDWLLAGDVPWRTFIGTVQRLKMVRRDG